MPVVLEGHTEGGSNTDKLQSFVFLLNLANIRQTAIVKEGHGVLIVGIPITDSPCNYRNPTHGKKQFTVFYFSFSPQLREKKTLSYNSA